MINKHKQMICDNDNVILNDGVSILPGFMEVTPKGSSIFISGDPHNNSRNLSLLKNRVRDDEGSLLLNVEALTYIHSKKKIYHFCGMGCLMDYKIGHIKDVSIEKQT